MVDQNPNLWMDLVKHLAFWDCESIWIHGFPWNIFPWLCSSEWLKKKGGISGTKHRAWRVSSFGSPSRIPDIGRCRVVLDWAGLLGKIFTRNHGFSNACQGLCCIFSQIWGMVRVPRVCGLVYPVGLVDSPYLPHKHNWDIAPTYQVGWATKHGPFSSKNTLK